MDLPQRGILELTGKDRLSFLNGLITAETWDKQAKRPMPAGQWKYSFVLNLKGRIVADMNVMELGERTLVETDVRMVEPLAALFEAYHFAEQVKMRSRHDLHEIALHGPGSREILEKLGELPSDFGAAQTCASTKSSGTMRSVRRTIRRDNPASSSSWIARTPAPLDASRDRVRTAR